MKRTFVIAGILMILTAGMQAEGSAQIQGSGRDIVYLCIGRR